MPLNSSTEKRRKSATRSRLTFTRLIGGDVSFFCQFVLSGFSESSPSALLTNIAMRPMFFSRIENEMKSSKMLSFLVCSLPTLCN